MSEKTNKNFQFRNLTNKMASIPNAFPKGAVGERQRMAAWLKKKAEDKNCMKDVKFTPAKIL